MIFGLLKGAVVVAAVVTSSVSSDSCAGFASHQDLDIPYWSHEPLLRSNPISPTRISPNDVRVSASVVQAQRAIPKCCRVLPIRPLASAMPVVSLSLTHLALLGAPNNTVFQGDLVRPDRGAFPAAQTFTFVSDRQSLFSVFRS
jgi:hypothetical protein